MREAGADRTGSTVGGSVHVVVAGDDERMSAIVTVLQEHSCTVRTTDRAKLVPDLCDEHPPDAVVLEIAAPKRDVALDMLDWLRRSANVGVIVITDPADVDARVRAIALRAEDAVAPVDPREIVARVAVLARRSRMRMPERRPLGDLTVDHDGRRVTRRGSSASLTQRELQVLDVLTSHVGRVVSKDELLDEVWAGKPRSLNAVEAQISALRRKLHDLGPPIIHTAHGEGYVFRPTVEAEPRQRSHLVAERERILREREEAVAHRAKLLRQLEEQFQRRNALFRPGGERVGEA